MPFNTAPTQEEKSEKASSHSRPFWHTPLSAGFGGWAAGLTFFICEGSKKKAQTGQPFSLHPRELMRGSSAYSTCVMTASIVQISLDAGIKSMEGFDHHSNVHKGLAAAASGAVGGVFSTFVENTILWQQLNKCGPVSAVSGMLNQGIQRPFVGLVPLIIREKGFGLTMLFAAPLAGKYAAEKWGPSWEFPGSIAAGMVGGIATHGPDTIASRMQKDQVSMRQAIGSIYQKDGCRGFLKGGAWRAFGLFPGCAVAIPFFTDIGRQGIEKVDDTVSESMSSWSKPKPR